MLGIHLGDTVSIPVKIIGSKCGMVHPVEIKIELDGHKLWIKGEKLLELMEESDEQFRDDYADYLYNADYHIAD